MVERKKFREPAIPDDHLILKYSGIFDLKGLYGTITEWFIDYGFYLEEPSWKHKVPSPSGAEQEIEFTGWKKINEYVIYWVELYIHIYDLVDVDFLKESVKNKYLYCERNSSFCEKISLWYKQINFASP